jgi:hypothetical protein
MGLTERFTSMISKLIQHSAAPVFIATRRDPEWQVSFDMIQRGSEQILHFKV